MPAIMTHDFFGHDALAVADGELSLASSDERDAFLLGNQGPDPLFYLVADPLVDASMRLGGLMHHERPSRLLCAFHEAVHLLPAGARSLGRAYAAGFLCHYLLDSTVHPLVFAQQYAICDAGVEGLDRSDGSLVHAEIERDLDEMVLFSKTGRTVRDYRPYREVLGASREVLGVIDRLYVTACLRTYGRVLRADAYTRAVLSFRRVQHLFWSTSSARRETLGVVERLASGGRFSLYCAMAHRVRPEGTSAFDNRGHRTWTDPFTCLLSRACFWDLYRGALERVRPAMSAFCCEGFGEGIASRLTGGRNFSGEPVEDWGHAEGGGTA